MNTARWKKKNEGSINMIKSLLKREELADSCLLFFLAFIQFCIGFRRPLGIPPFVFEGYMNTDAQFWLGAAKSLWGSIWIDRPIYPRLAGALSESKLWNALGLDLLAAFHFWNFVIYVLTVLIFYFALRRLKVPRPVCMGSAILYLSSHITLTWLNQPLPQLVDYLLAATILWALTIKNGLKRPESYFYCFLFAGTIGMFCLVKPYFFAIAFIVGLYLYFKRYREAVLALLVSIAPYLGWRIIVTKIYGHAWYSHSMGSTYKQGTWIVEALKSGEMARIWEGLLQGYNGLLSSILLITPPLALMLMVALLMSNYRIRIQDGFKFVKYPALALLAWGSLFLLAFGMRGYYPQRIAFTAFPLVLTPIAMLLWKSLTNRPLAVLKWTPPLGRRKTEGSSLGQQTDFLRWFICMLRHQVVSVQELGSISVQRMVFWLLIGIYVIFNNFFLKYMLHA